MYTCAHRHLDKVNIANLDELQNHYVDLIRGRTTSDYISHVCEKYKHWKVRHREGNHVMFSTLDIKEHPSHNKLSPHSHSSGSNKKGQTVTRTWRNPSPVRYGDRVKLRSHFGKWFTVP